LADLYALDGGLPKNFAKAAKWYRKAAENGNTQAMNNIGLLYARGQGVRKSTATAVRWFRKGAEAGEPEAMYNLGALMEDGDGVRKNDRQAAQWIFKALKGGSTFARQTMTQNIGTFSTQFRREMQRLLKAEGVYDGAIDGKFGPGTRRAIEAVAAQ
ncbi:MAG: SEL1-like repeat protein, partial [Pirellulales bacterium]|nr:SEL1-like repeat protein [Pirellulales bacterium]